ncbi:MAG: hypothetical protein ACXVZV_00265 [Terriglobales bacterium]
MRIAYILVLVLAGCMVSLAQDDSASVADAARKIHPNAGKAKTVITEENINSARGPVPDINIDGVDNSDEIIKTICAYRKNHTPEETELVVRGWYDRYDMMFQKALDENNAIKSRVQDRVGHPPTLTYRDDEDAYRRYEEIRRDQALSDLQDQRKVQKNGLLEARIQQTLQKVRNGISSAGMRYEWMKIRFGNGNGSW